MASVNQTRPHCVNQMGKTHSKPLSARHGRGGERHGHGMLRVNRLQLRHSGFSRVIYFYGDTLHSRGGLTLPGYSGASHLWVLSVDIASRQLTST